MTERSDSFDSHSPANERVYELQSVEFIDLYGPCQGTFFHDHNRRASTKDDGILQRGIAKDLPVVDKKNILAERR